MQRYVNDGASVMFDKYFLVKRTSPAQRLIGLSQWRNTNYPLRSNLIDYCQIFQSCLV